MEVRQCPHGKPLGEGKAIRHMTDCPSCHNFLKRRGSRRRRHLYLVYAGRCFYCGEPLTIKDSTIDHWIPKSRGGPNEMDNLRLSCLTCNRLKGSTLPEDLPENWSETRPPDA